MRLNALQCGLFRFGPIWFVLGAIVAVCPFARAMEHVTLKNGFELDCVRREVVGDKIRLYLAGNGTASSSDTNYLEVATDSIVRVETIADPPKPVVLVKMPD